MPVPAVIANAARDFRYNDDFLANMVQDIPHNDWFKQPNSTSNHIAWIVGHVIWTRSRLLAKLGTEWSAPWLNLCARGAKLEDAANYPKSDEMIAAWREVSSVLANTLENIPEEALAQPATPPGPPSPDGKISGIVQFLAWHETYHIGQASYVRGWLGHKGLMG